jgi:phage terminase large subunit
LESEFRVTEQTIVHVHTGSVFVFVGLSVNSDRIRSFEGVDIFWIEEAASISQRVWDILIPTVRAGLDTDLLLEPEPADRSGRRLLQKWQGRVRRQPVV